MKRIIIVAAILAATAVNAHAANQLVVKWYDTIRPHGHKRSDTISQANLARCNADVGEQFESVSPEFKACMGRLGYRFMSARTRQVGAERGVTIYNRDSRDPDIGWHDEGNGMRVCHNDCDNPEIPGSGYTCRNVEFMGTPMRQCDKHS